MPPEEPRIIKLKICLVGDEGVGKTSLIRRFVTGQFDDAYIRTLGAVVSKKSVEVRNGRGSPSQVDMVILDIIGRRTFMQLFQDAYFSGARGVIAVFDLTRKTTLRELPPGSTACGRPSGGCLSSPSRTRTISRVDMKPARRTSRKSLARSA